MVSVLVGKGDKNKEAGACEGGVGIIRLGANTFKLNDIGITKGLVPFMMIGRNRSHRFVCLQ